MNRSPVTFTALKIICRETTNGGPDPHPYTLSLPGMGRCNPKYKDSVNMYLLCQMSLILP